MITPLCLHVFRVSQTKVQEQAAGRDAMPQCSSTAHGKLQGASGRSVSVPASLSCTNLICVPDKRLFSIWLLEWASIELSDDLRLAMGQAGHESKHL